MANVLIVAYLLIVLALITIILIQRSEGGGLGMGGGGGGSGLVSARGSANVLTRTTAILAALFMATAIALSIVASIDGDANSILDNAEITLPGEENSVLDALNSMQPANNDNSLAIPQIDGATPADTSSPQDSSLPVPQTPAAPVNNN
ncbi:Protein translocase membrane subunit SecG [hydrothermal vent metagenome]|uniref:Protein translocase membrane subunit SecG n=1 Tax=hydrothermal vent metagenome TaxID=652676 RepID=A0A3B0TPF4_9ZZZZ